MFVFPTLTFYKLTLTTHCVKYLWKNICEKTNRFFKLVFCNLNEKEEKELFVITQLQ